MILLVIADHHHRHVAIVVIVIIIITTTTIIIIIVILIIVVVIIIITLLLLLPSSPQTFTPSHLPDPSILFLCTQQRLKCNTEKAFDPAVERSKLGASVNVLSSLSAAPNRATR